MGAVLSSLLPLIAAANPLVFQTTPYFGEQETVDSTSFVSIDWCFVGTELVDVGIRSDDAEPELLVGTDSRTGRALPGTSFLGCRADGVLLSRRKTGELYPFTG